MKIKKSQGSKADSSRHKRGKIVRGGHDGELAMVNLGLLDELGHNLEEIPAELLELGIGIRLLGLLLLNSSGSGGPSI